MSGVKGNFMGLAKAIAAMQGMAAVPALSVKAISQALEVKVHSCFRQRKAPDGTAWAPDKDGHRRILHETGALEASIHEVSGAATIKLEATDEKARWHQEGTTTIPARPFFPTTGHLPERWAKDLRAIPRRLMAAATKGSGA